MRRSNETASQNIPTTIPATAASNNTTESNVPCGSAICASNVDVIRGPSVGGVPQEPFLYGDRQKLGLLQLIDAHPAYLSERRLGARLDFGVAPKARLPVSFQRHSGDDVDRMASLPQELAHVEDAGEAGSEARLFGEFAARTLRYRLAWLEPASREHPVRVPVRFLVAHKEQGSLPLHHRRNPDPEVHTVRFTILVHAASIPARRP